MADEGTYYDPATDALLRLFDQAYNTAGDAAGRARAIKDYRLLAVALTHATTPERIATYESAPPPGEGDGA